MSNSFIDFSRDYINTFISRESALIKDGALVLDAGAGDPDFQNHDNRLHYITYDLAVGQEDWDYSGLDVSVLLRSAHLKMNRLTLSAAPKFLNIFQNLKLC